MKEILINTFSACSCVVFHHEPFNLFTQELKELDLSLSSVFSLSSFLDAVSSEMVQTKPGSGSETCVSTDFFIFAFGLLATCVEALSEVRIRSLCLQVNGGFDRLCSAFLWNPQPP